MKQKQIICLMIIMVLVIAGIYVYARYSQKEIIVKLISIDPAINSTGGNFIETASLYEGQLNFTDIKTNKEYSIFACSSDWSWVKEGNCYKVSLREINKNIDNHMHSAMLSGCYVGALNQTSC